jgi:hypothetical protein
MSRQFYLLDPVTESVDQILSDPSTSHWLRSALSTILMRDPVNAQNDVDKLLGVLVNKQNERKAEE